MNVHLWKGMWTHPTTNLSERPKPDSAPQPYWKITMVINHVSKSWDDAPNTLLYTNIVLAMENPAFRCYLQGKMWIFPWGIDRSSWDDPSNPYVTLLSIHPWLKTGDFVVLNILQTLQVSAPRSCPRLKNFQDWQPQKSLGKKWRKTSSASKLAIHFFCLKESMKIWRQPKHCTILNGNPKKMLIDVASTCIYFPPPPPKKKV